MKTKIVKTTNMAPVEQEVIKYISEDGVEWDSEYLANCRNDLLILEERYRWQIVTRDGAEYNIGYFDSEKNMMNFLKSKYGHLGNVHLLNKNPAFPQWFMVEYDIEFGFVHTYIYSAVELNNMIAQTEEEIKKIKKIISS